MKKYIIISSLISGLIGSSQAANLILNGSFELPLVADGGYTVTLSIPNWTVAGTEPVEIQNNIRGVAADGLNLAELDGFTNADLYQDVVTLTGAKYTLSLQFTPRPGINTTNGFAADSNDVEVWADGVLLQTLGGEGSAVNPHSGNLQGNFPTNWNTYTYEFTATGASTRIEFRGAGTSDAFGGYIDDVQLSASPVPEGGSAALLLTTGLLGLESARRRLKALA